MYSSTKSAAEIHKILNVGRSALMALPMSGYIRARLAFLGGVKYVRIKEDSKFDVFIGQNCQIDSMHPELISIGNWTTIATGSVILSHFLNSEQSYFPYFQHDFGCVSIGRGVFIGANCVICKPVSIGDGAIVAAGSIVLNDIPPYEIWGGNPAHFLKKRNHILPK